jgi:prepilin-type N-terminal cleavage/methylation domain-containing protein
MSKKNNGFTLVELLVVIAIISVLSILFVNTATLNLKRGRDARRKSDLELIRSGIETYRADCNVYPAAVTFGSSLKGSGNPINCAAANTYISVVPQDPQSTMGPAYVYWSNGSTYEICANLETGSGSATCGGSSACGSATCNYQVISP